MVNVNKFYAGINTCLPSAIATHHRSVESV